MNGGRENIQPVKRRSVVGLRVSSTPATGLGTYRLVLHSDHAATPPSPNKFLSQALLSRLSVKALVILYRVSTGQALIGSTGSWAHESESPSPSHRRYLELADDMADQFTLISVAKLLKEYLPQTQQPCPVRPKAFAFPDECVANEKKWVNVPARSGCLDLLTYFLQVDTAHSKHLCPSVKFFCTKDTSSSLGEKSHPDITAVASGNAEIIREHDTLLS